MTLTVVVGASGSGKTTFLNDVHTSHQCTYIRQYHNMRPYIAVSAIPNFDPTKLPYWDNYVQEKKDKTIIVGGTIAGTYMAGLSGGQRKLLLFELIFQRTANQKSSLIILDEPFAGVTDDFVPFIVKRLNEMRIQHNILLVTNDHVNTLKSMADNYITVSAIDRTKVKINDKMHVDRGLALLAMSMGGEYLPHTSKEDLSFFRKVEFSKNGGILNIFLFAVVYFGMFVFSFWNSQPGSEAFILVAAGLVSFFSINPYVLSLSYWRIYMIEESEALMHSSRKMNKFLKFLTVIVLIVVITSIQFGCQVLVIGTMSSVEFYFAIFFENASTVSLFILLGLYSDLTYQGVQIVGVMPGVFSILFSTMYSPGSGLKGVKELRYLFPEFYLWCMLPVDLGMEGCVEENNLLYMFLSALLAPVIFLIWKLSQNIRTHYSNKMVVSNRESMTKSVDFAELQFTLYGEKALSHLHQLSAYNLMKLSKRLSMSGHEISYGEQTTRKTNETDHTFSLEGEVDDSEGLEGFVSFLHDSTTKFGGVIAVRC